MARKTIPKTVSLTQDHLEYLEKVAQDLWGDEPFNLTETLREVINYHQEHPANNKESTGKKGK